VVALFENRKSRQDIVSEYELTASALDRWIMQFQQSGSFKEKDNRSPEEQELAKENQGYDWSNVEGLSSI
jgi:transposase